MKLRTKIIIDRVIGIPIVYSLNILARFLGLLLRIDHSLSKPVKTIAVCKFVGLGSIIQAIPLLQTLRKAYPDARILFITSASNAALLKHIDPVDDIITISDSGAFSLIRSSVALLFKLWKQRPDVYIDLEIYSNYSSVIATMSLSRNRMGFFKNDKTYRKGMYTHMMLYNVKSPVSQTYLQFARLLGCREILPQLSLCTDKIDQNKMALIQQKLAVKNLDQYIIINPNASDLRIERRWGAENVVALINALSRDFPSHKIVLIGSKDESEYVSNIYSALNLTTNVFNSSGKLSIDELIILISKSDLMITNDTGPMHIAFALNVKTVSLFGPCSPQQYGGLENTITIYKNVYCSPCVHEFIMPPCKGDNQCMKKITVDEVFNAVKVSLERSTTHSTLNYSAIDYINADSVPLGMVLRQEQKNV